MEWNAVINETYSERFVTLTTSLYAEAKMWVESNETGTYVKQEITKIDIDPFKVFNTTLKVLFPYITHKF